MATPERAGSSGGGATGTLTPAVLVLDFDGTVCVGDAPILAYAEQVAARLPHGCRAGFRRAVEQFLAGESALPGVEDGYQAVVHLVGDGLDEASLSAAYLASRQDLDHRATHPPDGLTAFLDEVRAQGAAVVLVTNAPLVGVDTWLSAHRVIDHLDAVIPDAGKPARMPEVLTGIMRQYRCEPGQVASVGDVWRNDIEPALDLGAAGMYIDRYGAGHGSATATARTFPGLYPRIRSWLQQVLTDVGGSPGGGAHAEGPGTQAWNREAPYTESSPN